MESDLFDRSVAGLQTLGYTLIRDSNWNYDFGGVGATLRRSDGQLVAAADPRWETWAVAK